MDTVKLLPTTKRLKQLIKEHGDTWTVLSRSDSVQAFNGDAGLFVEADEGKHTRWVRLTDVLGVPAAEAEVAKLKKAGWTQADFAAALRQQLEGA